MRGVGANESASVGAEIGGHLILCSGNGDVDGMHGGSRLVVLPRAHRIHPRHSCRQVSGGRKWP